MLIETWLLLMLFVTPTIFVSGIRLAMRRSRGTCKVYIPIYYEYKYTNGLMHIIL